MRLPCPVCMGIPSVRAPRRLHTKTLRSGSGRPELGRSSHEGADRPCASSSLLPFSFPRLARERTCEHLW